MAPGPLRTRHLGVPWGGQGAPAGAEWAGRRKRVSSAQRGSRGCPPDPAEAGEPQHPLSGGFSCALWDGCRHWWNQFSGMTGELPGASQDSSLKSPPTPVFFPPSVDWQQSWQESWRPLIAQSPPRGPVGPCVEPRHNHLVPHPPCGNCARFTDEETEAQGRRQVYQ